MNKRVMLVLLLVAALAIMTGCNNKTQGAGSLYAQIAMPDGGFVEGVVEEFTVLARDDRLLTIDGVMYRVHSSNVVLMSGVME